ncbi:MAG TPA: FG-GAP-like repeat-containing protein [Planctomycetia bacterium]|nr:FG-GAP-like repeat-containing protein [Planctomycetia bacterium]
MMRCRWMGALLAAMLAGCGEPAKPSSAGGKQQGIAINAPPTSAEDIAKHNRGCDLMDRWDYKNAEPIFQELHDKHPGWVDGTVNLAIVELNIDQGPKRAVPLLDEALGREPEHRRALYLKAYLAHPAPLGWKEATPIYERLLKSAPDDVYAKFRLADCYAEEEAGKLPQAIAMLEELRAADPNSVSVLYKLMAALRFAGRSPEAAKLQAEHDALKRMPFHWTWADKYRWVGPLAVIPRLGEPSAPKPVPAGELFAAAKPIAVTGVKWKGGEARPNMTTVDINGDGVLDLFLADAVDDAKAPNAMLMGAADGSWKAAAGHPLATVAGVRAALWGDVDEDGRVDVILCRDGGDRLMLQTAPGKFEDATAKWKLGDGAPAGSTGGVLADLDHDGDLDLYVVNEKGAGELWNNEGNKTFAPIAAKQGIAGKGPIDRALFFDFDGDRDLDLVLWRKTGSNEVFRNERTWKYAGGGPPLEQVRPFATAMGDADGDHLLDLFLWEESGLKRCAAEGTKTWKLASVAAELPAGKSGRWLASGDYDGDGRPDLAAGTDEEWAVYRFAGAEKAERIFHAKAATRGLLQVQTEPGRGPAIVGFAPGAGPTIWAPGPGRHASAGLALTGDKSNEPPRKGNRSAIGAKVGCRDGVKSFAQTNLGEQSGAGQSLQPMSVGAAGEPGVRSLQIDWSNGDFQVEFDLEAGKLHNLKETDRTPTSCPALFCWNGTRHEFVSDVLGVGGLGYLVKPGEFAPPQPREHFLLPAGMVAPRAGRFELKLVEPSEEITYLDAARLVAYDLPAGWSAAIDERAPIGAPAPTGALKFYRREAKLVRATDAAGKDLTSALAKADFEVAPHPPADPVFLGRLLEDQAIELEFERPLAELGGELMLVADGWVEFPYSVTTFAAWQAKAEYRPPALEARGADGKWRTVLAEFGYPAGMPRAFSVPLPKLPEGCRELRIRSNLQLCWDRIAVAASEPCPEAKRTKLPLAEAKLASVGLPAFRRMAQGRPHLVYDERTPAHLARFPAGEYTKFGDCLELTASEDDAVAIFGPGEEISLSFRDVLPAITGETTRRFLLELRGWCKDTDLYTEHGETVEPLPVTGKPAERRAALHRKYNTRIEVGAKP